MKHSITGMTLILISLTTWGAELSVDTATTITGSETSPQITGDFNYGCRADSPWSSGVTGTVSVIGLTRGESTIMKQCDVHDDNSNCEILDTGYYVTQVKCEWSLHNTGNWADETHWMSTYFKLSSKAVAAKVTVPALKQASASVPDTVDFGNVRVGETSTVYRDVTFSVTGGDPSGLDLEFSGGATGGGGTYEIVHMKTVDGQPAGEVHVVGTTGHSHITYGGNLHVTGNETLKFEYTPDKAYGKVTGTLAVTIEVP